MSTIYQFNSPADFLEYIWKEKKKHNKSFSVRAWAQELGMKQHGPLFEIIKGKRKVPSSYIPLFIDSLGLSPVEGQFFENLVLLNNAKDNRLRQRYEKRLQTLKDLHALTLNAKVVANQQFVTNPLNLIILELSTLPHFDSSPEWIQQHLNLDLEIEQIQESLHLLKDLGLVVQGNSNKLLKNTRHVYARDDSDASSAQQHVSQILKHASQQVLLQDASTNEFQSFVLNITLDKIPLARQLIHQFLREFINQIEASPLSGDQTYAMGIQFFSLMNEDK